MPRKPLPRILSVQANAQPCTLTIQWDQAGWPSRVALDDFLKKFKIFQKIRASAALFETAQVGEAGVDVVWADGSDIAAETLWRLAQEQAGTTMSADAFRHWRARNGYTLDDAAKALGISRRMVAYYERGEKPVPRVVALATLALSTGESVIFPPPAVGQNQT